MNGLATPARTELSCAPMYQEIHGGSCLHVSVLRQRYETLTAIDLTETTHDLGLPDGVPIEDGP